MGSTISRVTHLTSPAGLLQGGRLLGAIVTYSMTLGGSDQQEGQASIFIGNWAQKGVSCHSSRETEKVVGWSN